MIPTQSLVITTSDLLTFAGTTKALNCAAERRREEAWRAVCTLDPAVIPTEDVAACCADQDGGVRKKNSTA